MINATISADIVKSTSLSKESTIALKEHLERFTKMLKREIVGAWGRVVRGDSVECVLPSVKDAMRVAFMLKCHVKAFAVENPHLSHANFRRYGVRIAIGVGNLRMNDSDQGIIDGKAIYNSGRALDAMSARMRSTIVIAGAPEKQLKIIQSILDLSNELLSHATAKQCEVMCLRLRGKSENAVAVALKITQQAVNAHLRKAGWYAIESALRTYEEVV